VRDERADGAPGDVDGAFARLLRRAFLFDDPVAYEAGLRDAWELATTSRAGAVEDRAGSPARHEAAAEMR
jgi:hypothetical protein